MAVLVVMMMMAMAVIVMIVVYRYLYLTREDYEAMKARGAVACEEIVDEPSGETRFKILVSVAIVSSVTAVLRDSTPTKRTLPYPSWLTFRRLRSASGNQSPELNACSAPFTCFGLHGRAVRFLALPLPPCPIPPRM